MPVSCTAFPHAGFLQRTILDNLLLQEPKPCVLIVDDNADAADTLASLLTICGCTAHVAYSGIEALAIGDQLHPRFVILDIGMPRMDGCETARRMRERSWGRQACIAALTAWNDEDVRSRALAAGMDLYFVKPVTVDMLLGVLADGRA